MSRLNKWYNESRCKLEKEIWPELGADGRSKVKSEQAKPAQQTVAATSALDQHEYPKLGQKIKAGGPGMSKEIKQYYNTVNIMQKSRSRKVKSRDPITLDLENIIKTSATLSSKQKVLTAKRISKTESSSRSRRRVKHSKVKLPSSLKKAILWERELRSKRMVKNITEIDLDKLTLNQNDEEDISKNLGALNIFGLDYRVKVEVPLGDDTVNSRPDLIEALEKLKVSPKSVVRLESLESSFGRMSTREETLNEEVFDKSLRLNDNEQVRFSRKFREYCTNLVTPSLRFTLDAFLTEIKRLQRKLYERDEVKGRCKKRMYAGFKEVEKYILVDKIKFVIIATDVDKIIENGILDKTVEKFTDSCKKHQVAICYGFLRHKLGYFVHGKGIVSVVGIANYSGAESQFEAVLMELIKAKNEFNRLSMKPEKMVNLEKLFESGSFLVSQRINSMLKIASSIT